ncbi:MAG: ABC transporter substrate-binding protein [Oscillospiraceae bacterium]|nr:ABC transporter substrate-binding protein [Oscillospiraceae bacterium]
MKKFLSIVLLAVMVLNLVSCSNGSSGAEYRIGICQLVQHEALDAATEGFKAALSEKLGENVEFIEHNASGDAATCITICNQLVSENVDLVMANATSALQAAASATADIPIVGTSVTDYATALEISDWSGKTERNITGTADLAPLDEQAAIIHELFPEAENIGILYCSAEPNSVYQAGVVIEELEAMGLSCEVFTFADTNDVANVTAAACAASDVIYVPTDNTAASCAETINNVALPAGVPIVAGEENACKGFGAATLSVSYYDIGYIAGEMAYEILVNGANPGEMEIAFAPEFVKVYNSEICSALGIEVPEDYVSIG